MRSSTLPVWAIVVGSLLIFAIGLIIGFIVARSVIIAEGKKLIQSKIDTVTSKIPIGVGALSSLISAQS